MARQEEGQEGKEGEEGPERTPAHQEDARQVEGQVCRGQLPHHHHRLHQRARLLQQEGI